MNTRIYDEVHVPAFGDLEGSTKRRLRDETNHRTLGVQGDKLIYRNSRGRSLLDDIDAMKRQMDIIASQLEMIASEDEEQHKEIVSLKRQVGWLSQTSEPYLSTRRRFLDSFERDNKGKLTLKGSTAVEGGNA